MPTYSYRCPKCGHEYDKFQKMSDKTRAKCPRCSTRGERVISGGAGLVFKGSGFYITDYGRAGDKAGEKRETPAAEGGKKKDSKSKPTGSSKSDKSTGAKS